MRAAAPRRAKTWVLSIGGRLRGRWGRVRAFFPGGRLPARAEGQEVAAVTPRAGGGRIAAEGEAVEGPAQATADLCQKGRVPVDGVDLGGTVGPQVAVART